MLLIYGYGGSRVQWPPRFLDLLAPDFELITFDNRGTGESSRPDESWTMADFADDAAGLLDHLKLRAAHVLGLSMGGMIAQELALRHGRRVDRLILSDTHAGTRTAVPSPPWVAETFQIDPELSPEEQAKKSRPAVYSERFIAEHGDWLDERFAATLADRSPLKTFQQHQEAIRDWDGYERLPRIRQHTLVMHGSEDVLVLPENGRAIAEQIPDARFELVAGSGHIPMAEQPEATAALVRAFLCEPI